MRIIDLIERKKRGGILLPEEIHEWIAGVVGETVPDYQSAALLMAIYFQGLSEEETVSLTVEMLHSGQSLDLSSIDGITADKHSTGGVGDKLSFLVGPLAAACGVPVPMLSGRALGHTGGTLDKLETIPGYQTRLPPERFVEIVRTVGISIIGQTESLAPADGKLYALRDVTGTVDSIPLIVSSILSKKLAAGPQALVFDVKCGDGAFLPDREACGRLARLLVDVSARMGRAAAALITNMDVPLGRKVGNSLEIEESIEVLRGGDGGDMMDVSLALAGEMIVLAGRASCEEEAKAQLQKALSSGKALEVFRNMIEAHGGEGRVVEDPSLLQRARLQREVKAPEGGTVQRLSARAIGYAAMRLGAGREKVEDRVSAGAGIEILSKPGETVGKGEPLAIVHADEEALLDRAQPEVLGAFQVGRGAPPDPVSVYETVRCLPDGWRR